MPLVKEEKRPKAKNKKYSRQKKATCTTSKHSWFGALTNHQRLSQQRCRWKKTPFHG
jgi:hypothetical protein